MTKKQNWYKYFVLRSTAAAEPHHSNDKENQLPKQGEIDKNSY